MRCSAYWMTPIGVALIFGGTLVRKLRFIERTTAATSVGDHDERCGGGWSSVRCDRERL